MAEQIVKLLPTNRFSEQAVPTAFIGSTLLDFMVPGQMGTYDFSKSYININASIIHVPDPAKPVQGVTSTDTALYSSEITLQTGADATALFVTPAACLVRNAQMFSQNRGMVESIRRQDTLRQILFNLENDQKEIENGLDKLGSFNGRRGPLNQTSSFQNTVVNNTNSAGVVDLNQKSYGIARDMRIPLSDLFGVGNAMWNGSVYGDTRINLELNINRLLLQQLGGFENVTKVPNSLSLPPVQTGTSYGSCLDQPATTVAGVSYNTLILGRNGGVGEVETPYCDYGLNMPFHVGQSIVVNGFNNLLMTAGVINTVNVSNPGTGYVVGEYVELPAHVGAGAVREAWAVVKTIGAGGTVLTVEEFSNPFDLAPNNAGPGGGYQLTSVIDFPATSKLADGTAGAGTGAQIQIVGLKESGNIETVKAVKVNAGTLYVVADEGTFTGGTGTGARYKVKTVDAGGLVSELLILDPGQGYSVDDVLSGVATSGVGVNLQIGIETVMNPPVIVFPAAQDPTSAIPEIRVIIDSIKYDRSATQPLVQPGGSITITTRTPFYVGSTTRIGEIINDITIKADLASETLSQIRLNKAEIVLSVMSGVNGPNQIDYRTYTTDEQNGNQQPSYFHQYQVEGEAQNFIVGLCENQAISPEGSFNSYRLAIENNDQTGNRSVVFNSSLYQDRILRFMRNRGQDPSNLSIKMKATNLPQQNDENQIDFYPILETLPISALPKSLTLNIEAASNEQVILYKEITKTI